MIDGQPHVGQRPEQRVTDLGSNGDVLAVEVTGDHVGDQAVADRDEVQSRGVERIQKDPRVAGQAPPVPPVEHLGHAVAVLLHDPEVADLVLVLGQHGCALRFVLGQPRARLLECVELVEGVEFRVSHDADARRAGGETNEPDPVSLAHQMVGGHGALALRQPAVPARIVAPGADVDLRRHPEPRCVAMMFVGASEFELARQHAVASRRIDHPARRRLRGHVALLEGHGVQSPLGPEVHRADATVHDVDALGNAAAIKFVFQSAAIDLVGDLRDEYRAADFHSLRDIGVSVVRKKHPQAHLTDV